MNISIFGLGYVGCVSLGCLSKMGHNVIGVDISEEKVNLINKGKSTIIENNIDDIISLGKKSGRIEATLDYEYAIKNSDLSFICVGTPSLPNGHLNLDYIIKTAEQIAESLKKKNKYHLIVIRSTVPPGTNKRYQSIFKNYNISDDLFGVASNPEFLREGNAVYDFFNPPYIVIGAGNEKDYSLLQSIYVDLPTKIYNVPIDIAEMIKYLNNSFHALKVAFANEIGVICKKMGINSHSLMDLFIADTKLNISGKYFKPGFAYGGSCLPKDLKGLNMISHDLFLESPILNAIEKSNDYHKKYINNIIENLGKKKIGIIGLSFKKGTDDLRYSPSVDMAQNFLGKGYEIFLYDENVYIAKIVGSNKTFINQRIPHLSDLLVESIEKLFEKSEVIIVTHSLSDKDIKDINFDLNSEKLIIDLVNINDLKKFNNYYGLAW